MRAWRITAALGLGVAAVAALLLTLFPTTGAGYPPGFGEPVFAFEMARSVDGLQAVFGDLSDPERVARIASMDRGNLGDLLFMAVYGPFVASFFVAIHRAGGSRGWLVFAALGLFAAACDAVENSILLGLTADLEGGAGLAVLPVPVWLKFGALMLCGVAGGVYVAGRGGLWGLLGGSAAVGALAVAAAFTAPDQHGWMVGIGLGIGWLVQLAYAVRRGWGGAD
ncbi:MAG: hypothetical protein ACI8PZ_006427 [Myxococcota bacterium]|jgi:hypothetical protein